MVCRISYNHFNTQLFIFSIELLSPALDELEPILGDSFDFQQMITALRRFNYETQSAIDWLMSELMRLYSFL